MFSVLIEAEQPSVFDLVLVLIASGMPRCASLSVAIQSAWLTSGVFPVDHIESMMKRQTSNEVSKYVHHLLNTDEFIFAYVATVMETSCPCIKKFDILVA
jgi:hypothetical protein